MPKIAKGIDAFAESNATAKKIAENIVTCVSVTKSFNLAGLQASTTIFPNLTMKGPVQTMRVFKPTAVDKTLVESWTFRLVGAPDLLLERTLMYNRLINAPTSVVAHDDTEVYERAQEALHSRGRDWMNLCRLYDAGEPRDAAHFETNGTNELQMRNPMRAWAHYMTVGMGEQPQGSAA